MPPMKVGGVRLLFFAAVSYTERKHGKGKGGSVRKFIKREFFPFWKLFLLLFAAGFVLGTVFANLAYQNRGQDVTELQMFSLEAVGSAVPDSKDYFFYLLPRRLAGMAVLQRCDCTGCAAGDRGASGIWLFLWNISWYCAAAERNPGNAPVCGSAFAAVSALCSGGFWNVYSDLLYVRASDTEKPFFWKKGGAVQPVVPAVSDGRLMGDFAGMLCKSVDSAMAD